jgi:ribosomal protein L29
MKTTVLKQEFAQMSTQELVEKLDAMRRELFSLRLNVSVAHIKDYSLFKKLRKDIARALTYLHQKQQKGL